MAYRQRGRADRARESNSVGATVAFYHDPVEAHHAGAVVTARIEPGRRAAQHRSGDRTGEAVERSEERRVGKEGSSRWATVPRQKSQADGARAGARRDGRP